MTKKPDIIFVPGLWEGPSVFDTVRTSLSSHGYTTHVAPLESTGTTNKTMADDIAGITKVIDAVVDQGIEVVLVLHSAGGFLGSAAIKNSVKGLLDERAEGGVMKIVFLAAGLLEEGTMHPEVLPFYDIKGDEMWCIDPMALLFSDLPQALGEEWLAKLKPQPAAGWAGVVEDADFRRVPSIYLVCEGDKVLPPAMQLGFAALAGSEPRFGVPGCEIEKCSAGHMVMLSQPDKVVEVVRKAAGEIL